MKLIRHVSAVFVLGLLALGTALAGSGYTVNGVDLDSILAPYHAGWPQAAATGFKVGGADLNARYAPLSTGSAASATGYKVGGTDLNAIFAAIGSTGVQVAAQPSSVSGSAAAGYPSGTVTSNSTSTAGTKGGGSYSYTWHIASGSGGFTSGSSATTDVTGTVNAGSTSSGTMYCTISDGVSSANTNTVGWSLQNTTPANPSFSITAGVHVSGTQSWTGYSSTSGLGTGTGSPVIGSGSNLTLPDGHTVAVVYDYTDTGVTQNAYVVIGGFSSDPGVHYFTSVTANGKTHNTSESTLQYTYSGGYATWNWHTNDDTQVFGFVSGDAYTVNLTY